MNQIYEKPPYQNDLESWQQNFNHSQETQAFLAELDSALKQGITYIPKHYEGESYTIKTLDPNNLEDLQMIEHISLASEKEDAVVDIKGETIFSLAKKGLALIAVKNDFNGNPTNEFASYLGAEDLTPEEVHQRQSDPLRQVCEVRSALTENNHRERGLYGFMRKIQTFRLASIYGLVPIAFTDDIPEFEGMEAIKSGAISNLQKFRFQPHPVNSLPEEIIEEIVEPCPADRCPHHNPNAPACKCMIWVPGTFILGEWKNDILGKIYNQMQLQ